jgi:hypothetical protein
MKTVDFGQYDANGAQVVKDGGPSANEDVKATWITPDVCASGSLFVTQPDASNAELSVTFLNTTKVGMKDVSFQFGDKALKPNTAYEAVCKVTGSSQGPVFKLGIKSRG